MIHASTSSLKALSRFSQWYKTFFFSPFHGKDPFVLGLLAHSSIIDLLYRSTFLVFIVPFSSTFWVGFALWSLENLRTRILCWWLDVLREWRLFALLLLGPLPVPYSQWHISSTNRQIMVPLYFNEIKIYFQASNEEFGLFWRPSYEFFATGACLEWPLFQFWLHLPHVKSGSR